MDQINELLKVDDDVLPKIASRKFENSQRHINGICRSLSTPSQQYNPQKTITLIQEYLSMPDRLERILYSEISNYIFALSNDTRGIFTTNMEKLLHYSLDDASSIDGDCKKIIIKMYDHSQLAVYQLESMSNTFLDGIEITKKEIQKDLKSIEKEYITILGIFAAIILAFVGGITFSSSVLQYMSTVSIYRLLLVIDMLGFILTNVIYLLMKFIFVLNGHNLELLKLRCLNIAFAILGGAIIVCWLYMNHCHP